MHRGRTGRDYGKSFEILLEHSAHRQGILLVPSGQQTRVGRGGHLIAIKSNLDYTLVRKDGRVAFVDAKSFACDFFTYSQITPHQLERSVRYESYNCPSGFAVQFRESARYAFFSGTLLAQKGPRSRFSFEEGIDLGPYCQLDLQAIFTCQPVKT